MDIGTIFSVIQTILSALHCPQLQEAWSIWGYKHDLDELASVVATIKKVFLDAEAKHDALSHETLLYIEELRDALYDADDLLDEFVTLAKQKLLIEDDKFVKKARVFFSRYNQLRVAYNMSQGVKKIMKKLDGIASRHSKFGLNLDHRPIKRRREETCSYADTQIIGRGEDVEKIVGMLVNPDVQRDVSFLSIVGVGGLGKTALAQLVYNHENVTNEFPLRLWTCVSDHDQTNLDVKIILARILESATGEKNDGNSLDVVVCRLRDVLAQKRFLIVLDDLWTESRYELEKLVGHLVGGENGSQVLVTTRSKETAKMVGNGLTYELKGLSDENSWVLFQQMAFEQVQDLEKSNDYIDCINLGKAIVKRCSNVPLAIRVIGSLLYGQHKSKWVSFQELGLAYLRDDQDGIKPILKLSYHNLESPLKSCFSYCSLFPKDKRIVKEMLISLWIAQGYVVPLAQGQSIDDACEEYFSILLCRCFFQDILTDKFGEILSFKLHDLMHDVALEVAQNEICIASSFTGVVDKKIRHVSLMRKQYAYDSFTKAHIRTYLHVDTLYGYKSTKDVSLDGLLASYRCLRTLDLSSLGLKTLSASIGKLIHLRYLDISYNPDLEVLPKSITKLYNLQTLNLDRCRRLKDLPKDLSKLVNLRVLELRGCYCLTFMPSRMISYTDHHAWPKYLVGKGSSNLKQHTLKKLRGDIEIVIHFAKSGGFVKDDTLKDGGYIRDNTHLNKISLRFEHEEINDGATDYEEELLGALQPHGNLKELRLEGYRGVKMPRWAREDNLASFFPNLVRLDLYNCSDLKCLPSVGKMEYLKYLTLEDLPKLEYIQTLPNREQGLRFLPSLEKLTLKNLPNLKEWWGKPKESHGQDQSSLFLSRVIQLVIMNCPELTSVPRCPNLEELYLSRFNESLRIITDSTSCPKLRKVGIDNMAWLHSSLPMESFQTLTDLRVRPCLNTISGENARGGVWRREKGREGNRGKTFSFRIFPLTDSVTKLPRENKNLSY